MTRTAPISATPLCPRPALRWRRASIIAMVALAAVSVATRSLTAQHAPKLIPLKAKLQAPLDTSKLTVDAPVFAAVTEPWNGPSCTLLVGATVYGRVVALQSRAAGADQTRLTLTFEHADCNGSRAAEIPLLLYAVRDQPPPTSPYLYVTSSSLSRGTAGVQVRTNLSAEDDGQIKAGEVYGMSGVKLTVGTAEEPASTLLSSRKSFRVSESLQLVLLAVPGGGAAHPASARKEEAVSPAPMIAPVAATAVPPPPSPPPDETEVCRENCSPSGEDISPGNGRAASAEKVPTIALKEFGFRPRGHAEMTSFDDETTVHFLGEGQILLTFDPHALRSYTSHGWRSAGLRTVRAVLINARTARAERTVDWSVSDTGTYVWPAGPDRLLVHIGDTLRMIGPGLRTLEAVQVPGELQWLAISPDGKHAAVGLLQERHSREVHETIARLSGVEPEEDIQVRLIDFSTHTERTVLASSRTALPVLSDDGELRLEETNHGRWKLTEMSWTGTVRSVAQWNSGCEPQISAPVSGTVFIEGCAADGGLRWFRVLRLDGGTLLKGPSSSTRTQEWASGSRNGFLAVRMVQTKISLPSVALLSTSLLDGERIGVYRVRDGRRLMETWEPSFPESRDNFALSPDGDALAVLSSTAMKIIPVERPDR